MNAWVPRVKQNVTQGLGFARCCLFHLNETFEDEMLFTLEGLIVFTYTPTSLPISLFDYCFLKAGN